MSVQRVLFVCAGNICRSPMAEALFRREIERRTALRQIEVASAGTIAIEGHGPSPDAVAVLRESFGLDIGNHRATRLTRRVTADLILALDEQVAESIKALGVRARVALLGDYAGSEGESVNDPYLGPREGYELCATQLVRLLEAAAVRLEGELRSRSPDNR